MLPKINPTATDAWKKLRAHAAAMKNIHMKRLFAEDPARFRKFSVSLEDILVDYSKNRITAETLQLLAELAEACGLRESMDNSRIEAARRCEAQAKKGSGLPFTLFRTFWRVKGRPDPILTRASHLRAASVRE